MNYDGVEHATMDAATLQVDLPRCQEHLQGDIRRSCRPRTQTQARWTSPKATALNLVLHKLPGRCQQHGTGCLGGHSTTCSPKAVTPAHGSFSSCGCITRRHDETPHSGMTWRPGCSTAWRPPTRLPGRVHRRHGYSQPLAQTQNWSNADEQPQPAGCRELPADLRAGDQPLEGEATFDIFCNNYAAACELSATTTTT